jgi:hypothetical protein
MAVDEKAFDHMASRLALGGKDPAAIRARIEALEAVLERSITIPGVNYRIGLDAVLGLLPVGGDIIAGLMSAYIIWEARNLGMSKLQLARMTANTLFDTAVGAVPLVGDAFDFVFRSNTRNLRIIKRHLDRHHPETVTVDGEFSRRATRE